MNRSIVIVTFVLLLILPTLRAADQNPTTNPADNIKAGSVWSGEDTNDDRKAHHIERHCRLKIIDKDGDKFTAEYHEHHGNGTRGLKFEGKIEGGKIAMQAIKTLPGDNWGADVLNTIWKGQVNGNELVFTHQYNKDLTATCKLMLDKSGKGDLGTN